MGVDPTLTLTLTLTLTPTRTQNGQNWPKTRLRRFRMEREKLWTADHDSKARTTPTQFFNTQKIVEKS